jgi:hypothetical protein
LTLTAPGTTFTASPVPCQSSAEPREDGEELCSDNFRFFVVIRHTSISIPPELNVQILEHRLDDPKLICPLALVQDALDSLRSLRMLLDEAWWDNSLGDVFEAVEWRNFPLCCIACKTWWWPEVLSVFRCHHRAFIHRYSLMIPQATRVKISTSGT